MVINLETVLAALAATAGSLLMTRLARVFVWDADVATRLAQGRYGNGDFNTTVEQGAWTESVVRGYFMAKLAAALCRGREGCRLAVPTLAYTASLLVRNLALLALAGRLMGGQAVAALLVFLSLNALVFSYGNTDYWALGMARGTGMSENFTWAAFGLLLLGLPAWGFAALLASLACSPFSTLFLFGPGLVPATAWCLAVHGLTTASALVMALFLAAALAVLVLFAARLRGQEVDPESKALIQKIQYKYLFFRETLFRFHKHFPHAPWYLALALGTVVLGLWSLPDANLRWVLAATLGLGLAQWLAASVLVERGVALAQFGEFMRSVYWVGALLPLLWACALARTLPEGPGRHVLLAAVFLAGSFQVGKARAYNGPVQNCGINVHDRGLLNAAFAALPLLAWAGTWIPIDPEMISWALAGLMACLFLCSERMLLDRPRRFVVLGLALVLGVAGWWSRPWVGPVYPVCLLVLARLALESLCTPRRSFRNINRETRIPPFAPFVHGQSPEALFVVPYNFIVWHVLFRQRALLTNWMLLGLSHFDGHTGRKLELLRDAGALEYLADGGIAEGAGQALGRAWRELDEQRAALLARRHGADYLVREKALPLDLPVALDLSESAMTIYDLTGLKAEAPQP